LKILLDKTTADVGTTAKSAMLQNHVKGWRTEIDVINNLIVDEGRRLGPTTPVSHVLINLNQRIAVY